MSARIVPIGVAAWTVSTAAGLGAQALADAIRTHRSGLAPNADASMPLPTSVGRIHAIDTMDWPEAWREWDSRATRLARLAAAQDGFDAAVAAARERFGPRRVALALGTSAATIGASEAAYRHLDAEGRFPAGRRSPRLNTPHAIADVLQRGWAIEGPCVTVSTACSSSAKVFASAQRWLSLGWADAVVVGGVEALSASLLYGFRALGLVAEGPCRPFDAARGGISVGEAAGLALLTREDAPIRLVGHGESNDAHHMSSPHPQGLGAQKALDAALQRAGLAAADIDFVNLHGTASAMNDEVEAALVARRYRDDVHACATKGLTGHTMGAAGIVEAAVCFLALQGQGRAGSVHTAGADPAFGPVFARQLALRPDAERATRAASHSFGFGGNNAVLVFDAA